MMATDHDLLAPLHHLSALWPSGIDWPSCEKLEWLEYDNPSFEGYLASQLNLDTLRELLDIYQDAIELNVNLGRMNLLQLHPSFSPDDLAKFKIDIADSPNVELTLRINKKRLAEIYYAEILNAIPRDKECFLYFFPKRLEAYLTASKLEDLEVYFWKKNPGTKVVILLPSRDIQLIGARLWILGGSYLSSRKAIEVTARDEVLADMAYKVCRDNLKWQDAWLDFLTPWHLFVRGSPDINSEIKRILSLHFGNLALLYTSDLTFLHTADDQRRISRYNSPDRQVDISHVSTTAQIDLTSDQLENVKNIIDWIYDPQWSPSDRITLAQQNIVDQLCLVDEDDRFRSLFQKADTIRKNINWHWETFTRKKIDSYLGVVRELEEYLQDITEGYATNIATIQKTLNDNVLAAIGALIGSFIASLFEKQFNPNIFRIGMGLYGLYILCFPLLYNMIQQWKSSNYFNEQIEARRGRFLECLPTSKVNEIWTAWKIEAIRKRSTSNYWWTIGIYILIVVLSLLAAWIIPNWLITTSVSLATPTLTSLSTIASNTLIKMISIP